MKLRLIVPPARSASGMALSKAGLLHVLKYFFKFLINSILLESVLIILYI